MPEPHLHSKLGSPFIELQSTDSTNNYALGLVRAGLAQSGSAFFAHEQVSGKGQRGKIWKAEKDSSLILSIALKPQPLPVSAQFELSVCTAVAAVDFLRNYVAGGVKIKWPNDLYWHDRKAGGILIENIVSTQTIDKSSHWQWAVIGIGINVNQVFFPQELANAVSLRQITAKVFDSVILAKELCSILDERFNELLREGFKPLYDRYLLDLYKKDQPVRLKRDSRVFEALIKTVTPTGELIIEHGIEEAVRMGQIQWII